MSHLVSKHLYNFVLARKDLTEVKRTKNLSWKARKHNRHTCRNTGLRFTSRWHNFGGRQSFGKQLVLFSALLPPPSLESELPSPFLLQAAREHGCCGWVKQLLFAFPVFLASTFKADTRNSLKPISFQSMATEELVPDILAIVAARLKEQVLSDPK